MLPDFRGTLCLHAGAIQGNATIQPFDTHLLTVMGRCICLVCMRTYPVPGRRGHGRQLANIFTMLWKECAGRK